MNRRDGQPATATEQSRPHDLAQAIAAAMPRLDATDQQIAITIYRMLAEGEPASPESVAGASGVGVARVEEALASWPGVYRDERDDIIGFWGLAISPLDPEYSLQIDGKTSYAWCALDTLFIPPLLGNTVTVRATDPLNGEPVSLVVDSQGVRELTPPGAVVSMVIPDRPFGYDVIENFCHEVLFFTSEESGSRWVAGHEGTTLLTVQEAFEVGRFAPELVYPDLFGQRRR